MKRKPLYLAIFNIRNLIFSTTVLSHNFRGGFVNIKKVSYVILFVLFYLLSQACTVVAYDLGWSSIQHRVAEYRESYNRIQFDIRDDSGNYIFSKSLVTSVVLRYPNGTSVTLGELMLEYYQYTGAEFLSDISQWKYYSPEMISGFFADIESPLSIGTYTLEVSMENGQIITELINFDFLLDLPIISSGSFQIHTDSTGNVHWTWPIPEQLISLAKTNDLQVRAGVAAMFNDEMVALYWPNIPIEVGYCIVPSSTYQNLVNKADELSFLFQVRTSNNNARAYSKIVISDPSYTVSILPEASCPESKSPAVTTVNVTDASTPSGWARINGTVEYDGSPLCAMVLANGQYMFSCGTNNGTYDLTVPLDGNGQITLYVFVAGFQPYKQTFAP